MNKNVTFAAFTILLFAGFAGYFIYANLTAETEFAATPLLSETEELSANTSEEAVFVLEEVEKEEKTEENKGSLPDIPDLDRRVDIPSSIPSAQREEMTDKINDILALLKQDPDLFNEWLDLGLLRKSVEDYEGARQAWEYASVIRPKNSLSFSNLGVLYGYYLGKPILAEKNYLKAIENSPKLPYLYVQVADFYAEVLSDPEKARAILKRGISEIPGDEMLKIALDGI